MLIRQKGESLNSCFKKTKHVKFSEKQTLLTPDTHTYVCISGGKECLFFGTFGVLYFLDTTVLRFFLLPYNRGNTNPKSWLDTDLNLCGLKQRSNYINGAKRWNYKQISQKQFCKRHHTKKKIFFRAKSCRVIENTFYYSKTLNVYNKPFSR